MSQLKVTLEAYLDRIGRLGEERLGEHEDRVVRTVTDKENHDLARILEHSLKVNKYVVVFNVAALGMLFVAACLLLLHYRQDSRAVYGVLALLLLSNFGIIGWLRKLWWEMNVMDASMYVLRKLPPEQAAAFISRLYWDFLRSSSSGHPKMSRDGED